MELPLDLKRLYKHWAFHTSKKEIRNFNYFNINQEVLKQIEGLIRERMKIWEKKVILHECPPYTADPILSTYRFCNIYRELDRQTIEIHTLLLPLLDNFDLWLLNLAFCRFVCNVDTVKKCGFLSYDENSNKKVMENLLSLPSPKWGSAYLFPISILQKSNYNTRECFLCLYLPKVMQKIAKEIENFSYTSVVEALERVIPLLGFSFKFHFTEVLIDTAYQFPEKIDLFKLFPIGPGAKPTFKMLSPKLRPERACLQLTFHNPANFPYLTFENKPVYLSAENWEGIACEFRKYTNLVKGTGRKRIYRVCLQSDI